MDEYECPKCGDNLHPVNDETGHGYCDLHGYVGGIQTDPE